MSAPVDVLAVMARAFGAANEHYDDLRIEANEAPLGPAWERAGRYMMEQSEARAAVAELIEADKDYDDALAAFAAGPFPNLTPDSIDEWADEWARVAQRADLQDRLESAKTRRAAALARVQGGAV